MQYDALFKSIFQSGLNSLIPKLVGSPAVEQLNVEFRSLERRTPDLVARLEDGRILHIEIQTSNDADMPLRMLHYRVLLSLRFPKETIHQMVLYAGYPALSMQSGLEVHGLQYHYDLVDLRSLDANFLLASPQKGERMLAILCSTPDARRTIRDVLVSWQDASARERADLLLGLMIVSGLRKLSGAVKEEADNMAFDIEELVREFERGLIQEGEAAVLRRLLDRRFGPLSRELEERIQRATVTEIEEWSLRVLDARTLDDVFA